MNSGRGIGVAGYMGYIGEGRGKWEPLRYLGLWVSRFRFARRFAGGYYRCSNWDSYSPFLEK